MRMGYGIACQCGNEPASEIAGVNFNGLSQIVSEALTAAAADAITVAFWKRAATPGGFSSVVNNASPGRGYTYSVFEMSGVRLQIETDVTPPAPATQFDDVAPALPTYASAANWTFVIATIRGTGTTGGDRPGIAYVNGELIGKDTGGYFIGGAAYQIDIGGRPIYIGGDLFEEFWTGDMAEFWLAAADLTDPTATDPKNLYTEATIRKFMDADGKPVSLGANGQIPTGSAPIIYLSRRSDEAATAFLNNRGTGGAFTVDAGALGAAATLPQVAIPIVTTRPVATADGPGPGDEISTTAGVWSNAVGAATYQWVSIAEGENPAEFSELLGETASTLTIPATADTLYACRVTRSNASGDNTTTSNFLGPFA